MPKSANVGALTGALADFLIAFDPGLSSLRSALRGTLAVLLSFLILSFLAKLASQPSSLAFIGVLLSMMGSIVIADGPSREQKITSLLLPIPSSVALALAISLQPWPKLRIAGFLAATFLAVVLRRFGPRWTAVGTIVFMGYFFPLLFPIPFGAIPWVIGAVFTAAAVSFLIRFWLMADRPRRILGLLLRAFDLRIDRALSRIARLFALAAATPSLETNNDETKALRKLREKLQRDLLSVNELALTFETFLKTSDRRALRTNGESLQMLLFERELSLRNVIEASRAVFYKDIQNASARKADFISAAALLEEARRRLRSNKESTLGPGDPQLKASLQSMLELKLRPVHSAESLTKVADATDERAVTHTPGHFHLTTQQAIQATIATALATALGTLVSPVRWYWASLTAFVIFSGATRGETLTRACFRVIGTALGLIIGFLLAYGLSGQHALEWTLILSCVFCGIYGARMTFGFWTALSFSLMLALFYDVLGQMTREILFLRLEETLVGAVLGALVSAYVFPLSTHSAVRAALARLLRTASAILAQVASAPGSFPRRDVIHTLRAIDRDHQELRLAAAPLTGKLAVMRNSEVVGALYDASVLTHLVRHLLSEPAARADSTAAELRKFAMQLSGEASASARRVEEAAAGQRRVSAIPNEPISSQPKREHWLRRIDQVLMDLDSRTL